MKEKRHWKRQDYADSQQNAGPVAGVSQSAGKAWFTQTHASDLDGCELPSSNKPQLLLNTNASYSGSLLAEIGFDTPLPGVTYDLGTSKGYSSMPLLSCQFLLRY